MAPAEPTMPRGLSHSDEAAGRSASASVPMPNRVTPGTDRPPSFTPRPRVYRTGDQTPPTLPTRTPTDVPDAQQQRLPRQRQPRVPGYSDLLGPASDQDDQITRSGPPPAAQDPASGPPAPRSGAAPTLFPRPPDQPTLTGPHPGRGEPPSGPTAAPENATAPRTGSAAVPGSAPPTSTPPASPPPMGQATGFGRAEAYSSSVYPAEAAPGQPPRTAPYRPGPDQPQTYPPAPHQDPPPTPYRREPDHSPPYPSGSPSDGSPDPGQPPPAAIQPQSPPAAAIHSQRPPAAIQPENPPARSDPPPGAGDSDRAGPRLGVIVGVVLIGASLLVLVTIGAVFMLSQLTGTSSYGVGDCVVQSGSDAELADCDEPGAFRIVSEVNDQSECPDPAQPAVEVAGPPAQVFCLAPVSGPPGEDVPQPTGPPTGSADPEG